MKNNKYILIILLIAFSSCKYQSMNKKVEFQCELNDIRLIKNGKISVHEVTETSSKIVDMPVGKLKELIVACRDEVIFPKEIKFLTNLEMLSLGGGNFKEIPKEIGNLSKLKILALVNTGLTKLPIEFYTIPKLERLAIMYNMNEFEFQKSLCKEEFQIIVTKTSTEFKDLPPCIKNSRKIIVESREPY